MTRKPNKAEIGNSLWGISEEQLSTLSDFKRGWLEGAEGEVRRQERAEVCREIEERIDEEDAASTQRNPTKADQQNKGWTGDYRHGLDAAAAIVREVAGGGDQQ